MPSAAMMPRLGGGGGGGGCAAAASPRGQQQQVNVSGVPLEQSVLRGLTPPRPARNGGGGDGGGTKRPRERGEEGEQEQEQAVQRLLAQVPENDHRECRSLSAGWVCVPLLSFRSVG